MHLFSQKAYFLLSKFHLNIPTPWFLQFSSKYFFYEIHIYLPKRVTIYLAFRQLQVNIFLVIHRNIPCLHKWLLNHMGLYQGLYVSCIHTHKWPNPLMPLDIYTSYIPLVIWGYLLANKDHMIHNSGINAIVWCVYNGYIISQESQTFSCMNSAHLIIYIQLGYCKRFSLKMYLFTCGVACQYWP